MARFDSVLVNEYTQFQAMSSASASNNSIFLDTSDNKLKQKDNSGTVSDL